MRRGRGDASDRASRRSGLPFLATMFHAVGLNVMDARERKRDVLDASRRASRGMVCSKSWSKKNLARRGQKNHDNFMSKILRTPPRTLDLAPQTRDGSEPHLPTCRASGTHRQLLLSLVLCFSDTMTIRDTADSE